MAKPALTPEEQEANRRQIAELRVVADSLGLEVHPRMNADTLQRMITDKQQQQYHEQQLTAAREKQTVAAKIDKRAELDRLKSPEELESYIAAYIKRGVVLTCNLDDTWTMRFGKKEDTGHMTVSKNNLITAAERIITGRQPTGYQNDDGKVVLSA